MTTVLAPAPIDRAALATMSLADCPDLWTAVAAGIAHGLAPREAIRSAFHKYLGDNAEAIQHFGIANFYEPDDTSKAFVNHAALSEFLVITVAEQQRQIAALSRDLAAVRALVPLPATVRGLIHADV